jgi:hypothetical protein
MYTIIAGSYGVVVGCMDCPYAVHVNDYERRLGHPRTQAANAMNVHLNSHRMTSVPAAPRHGRVSFH